MENRFKDFTIMKLTLLKYSTSELIDILEKFSESRKTNADSISDLKRLKNEIEEQLQNIVKGL